VARIGFRGRSRRITHQGAVATLPLHYDPAAPGGAPSQFFSNQWIPGAEGVYAIAVSAYQKSTGNSGVGFTTVNLQS
jgi:hypothetical protein